MMKLKLTGLAVLGAYVLFVAAYIEITNVRAGNYLPNREYRNNDPADGVVKWRESPFQTERGLANNALRNFVATFGLTQYVAAPVLVLLATLVLLTRIRHRYYAAIPLGIGTVACVLMWHRAYFTSLGW